MPLLFKINFFLVMEVVNPCAALLSNYEVYLILKETRYVITKHGIFVTLVLIVNCIRTQNNTVALVFIHINMTCL